jgi:excisionase family DNA binding protein
MDDVLKVEAVADMLGCDVETVELMTRNKELPGLKKGRGGWRYPREALLKVLNELALKHVVGAGAGSIVPVQSQPRNRRRVPPELK